MLSALILVVVLGGASLAVLRASVQAVERSQRLIVERLGRFQRCAGPGYHVVVPFIDRGRLIELNEIVRGWQGMTDQEIHNRLLEKLYGTSEA